MAGLDVIGIRAVRADFTRFAPDGNLENLSYPTIARALQCGKTQTKLLILGVLRGMARDLSVAVRALSAEYGTSNFVFGGGLMEEGEIARRVIRFTQDLTHSSHNFYIAQLGNQAGLVGAAVPFMQSHTMEIDDVVLAIDIGGTKIAISPVNREGRMPHGSWQKMTPKNQKQLVSEVAICIRDIFRGFPDPSKIKALGICSPGIMRDGIVQEAAFFLENNQPFDFKSHLIAQLCQLGLPVDLDISILNDAEAATLGEKYFGAGSELESFVLMTFGTGLGGGVADVAGGVRNIEPGERSYELGIYGSESTVTLAYPEKKIFELFVSGTAFTRRVKEQLEIGA